MLYKLLVKPLLFLFSPEKAHHLTTSFLNTIFRVPGKKAFLRQLYSTENVLLEREVFGIKFKNPVGLAAGFDKNASIYRDLTAFGFGFIEIGTVTPKPQPGNPKPRMFRLTEDNGLINRMGFNNDGVEAVAENLRGRNQNLVIGGNIGKNKDTPNDQAIDDYTACFDKLFWYVDYFVVNVSSPNTPGLRDLQEKGPLKNILNKLQELNSDRARRKPILLKIAPDLTKEQLDDIVEIVLETKLDGVIATNTTISRKGLKAPGTKLEKIGPGGLSGRPLTQRATDVIRYLNKKFNGEVPIIGVGGIFTAQDAIDKIKAGASLVQVYTGFVYEGPAMVKRINKGLIKYFKSKL